MNSAFYIGHYLTDKEAESTEDLQSYFSRRNEKLMKDCGGQEKILVLIMIIENDLTNLKSMLEISAEDLKKLTDKAIRKLLHLGKYKKVNHGSLALIENAIHLNNLRETENFKKLKGEEFCSEYRKYALSDIDDRIN